MAYIIFVNPAILSETGMPLAAITAATCLCAAFGSILMGALANYPLALAPGMGLNAYFTYTVVKAMHVPWQTALGAVFLSDVGAPFAPGTAERQQMLFCPGATRAKKGLMRPSRTCALLRDLNGPTIPERCEYPHRCRACGRQMNVEDCVM